MTRSPATRLRRQGRADVVRIADERDRRLLRDDDLAAPGLTGRGDGLRLARDARDRARRDAARVRGAGLDHVLLLPVDATCTAWTRDALPFCRAR
jgi:hypothetical protein